MTAAICLKPDQATYNLPALAYFDSGECDLAIADFNEPLRLGPPNGTI